MGLFDQLRKKPPPLPTASEREALALVDAIETTPHMSTILIALDQRLGADAAALDGPERRFLETLRARLTTGRLELPAIPEVMLRLDRALRDPDVGVRVVADAVRAEPIATLKLIGVANAATFAGLGRVSTVEGAIGRLGFAETKRVVLAAALASRLTRVAGWEEDIERTYQHSIATALATQAIADRDAAPPDEHYLAGLVHDVGRSVVLAVVGELERQDRPRLLVAASFVRAVMSALHAELSALTLERWNGTPDAVVAVRFHPTPRLVGPLGARAMAYRLALADDLARYLLDPAIAARPLTDAADPEARLALAVDDGTLAELVEQVAVQARAFGLPVVGAEAARAAG
jgi:HD-like signal output (HDOD) protein